MSLTDVTGGHPDQAIRLFFSMDLAGASRFKYLHAPIRPVSDDPEAWPSIFIEFFQRASQRFRSELRVSEVQYSHHSYQLEFWKILGDEILFFSLQSERIQPYWQLRTFASVVHELHEEVQADYGGQLGVKGLVWSAGFPIRNKKVFVDFMSPTSVYEGDEESLAEVSGAEPAPGAIVDFMGLEMDQGFRLARHGYPGRVLCSPDACYLAARGFQEIEAGGARAARFAAPVRGPVASEPAFRIVQVGWEILPGVLGETPVPILWPEFVSPDVDVPQNRILRFSFEEGSSSYARAYKSTESMSALQYRIFFERWDEDLVRAKFDHIVPYIIPDATISDVQKKYWKGEEGTFHPPLELDTYSSENNK